MPIIVTPTASNVDDGAQIAYQATADRGIPGQIATIGPAAILSGANETGARIPFGVPLAVNGSGVLPNSAQVRTTAGALLGISVRTQTVERDGPPNYADGIPDGRAVNILTQGFIYLECWETVLPTDALRYFKSGVNAGKWGKTASVGNSLNLAAGGWAIRKGGSASQLLVLEINTPANLTVTAD